MKKLLIVSFVILIALIGCDESTNEPAGKVIFCTNAQAVLNCGPFDVEIYIGNSLAGVINEPCLSADHIPGCDIKSNDTFLVIEKPEGIYEFTAKHTCSETLRYMGEFEISEDSCSFVYMDLLNRLPKD